MSIQCLIQEKKRIVIIVLITQVIVKDNVISRFIPPVVILERGKEERWHEGDEERREGKVASTEGEKGKVIWRGKGES